MTSEQKAANLAAEQAARESANAKLHPEIIKEMVAGGARHVAANLTNTTTKMLMQGRKYGVL